MLNKYMNNFFPDKLKIKFSTKADGPMNFVGHEYYDSERRANRAQFLKSLNILAIQTVTPKVFHGAHIESVSAHNPIYGSILADAIITDKRELALTMTFGDCPPVIVYDPETLVLAIIHAGWKPLASKIIEKTVEKMKTDFNCFTGNLHAFIGPGICEEHYEVGPEVALKFGVDTHGEKTYLSLENEIKNQLLNQNIINIKHCGECTLHSENENGKEKYFSWRRDHSDPLETGMAVVTMI